MRKLILGAIIGLAVVLVVGVVGLWIAPYILLPSMLWNVTAGGQGDPCHPDPLYDNMPSDSPSRPRGSPELNERLKQEFSPGSPEERLVSALKRRGFEALPACENDPLIHRAYFRSEAIGVWAAVYWKVDAKSAIVWTRGDVAYTFL